VKPNSCEGRLLKTKTSQRENAPGKQQDNQSTFKEELWDTPPHPTPKHPRTALCVLKSPLDIFINSMQTLFSKVKSHNKETTKKNIVV